MRLVLSFLWVVLRETVCHPRQRSVLGERDGRVVVLWRDRSQ